VPTTITVFDAAILEELLEIRVPELVDAGRNDGLVGRRHELGRNVGCVLPPAAADTVEHGHARGARGIAECSHLRDRGDAARPARWIARLLVEVEEQERPSVLRSTVTAFTGGGSGALADAHSSMMLARGRRGPEHAARQCRRCASPRGPRSCAMASSFFVNWMIR
jgi:hypothetical protein